MNKELVLRDSNLPIALGNLETYISLAYSIPVLSLEEELDLATRFQQQSDSESAKKLAMHNLRFVVQIAKKNMGYGLPMEDLIQEGNIGLLKAIKRFNPCIGVRLATFAVYWIRSEIHEFIIRNWRIVKVATTKEQRKLFFKLRSSKKKLSWLTQEEVKDMANMLNVSPDSVVKMEMRLSRRDLPTEFSSSDSQEEMDSNALTVSRALTDQGDTATPESHYAVEQHNQKRREIFRRAFRTLDKRSAQVLQARWLNTKKATLAALGKKYGLSLERIRQIETQAILKLRSYISEGERLPATRKVSAVSTVPARR